MAIAGREPPKLQRVVRNKVVESHDLGPRTILGRSRSADLLLIDPSVSREHAVVHSEGERFIIEDLGSANGIKVNGTQTTRSALNEGDIVLCGDSILVFTRGQVALEPGHEVAVTEPDDLAVGADWEGAEDIRFTFGATDPLLEAAGEMTKRLVTNSCLAEHELHYLHWAVMEALSNGFRHGNRHDTSEPLRLRLVRQEARVTARIADAGDGFDFEERLAVARSGDAIGVARSRFESGGVGGLGIMLMVKCVDMVEFNERGNVVTLTKCPGDVFATQTIYGELGFQPDEPPELPEHPRATA